MQLIVFGTWPNKVIATNNISTTNTNNVHCRVLLPPVVSLDAVALPLKDQVLAENRGDDSEGKM